MPKCTFFEVKDIEEGQYRINSALQTAQCTGHECLQSLLKGTDIITSIGQMSLVYGLWRVHIVAFKSDEMFLEDRLLPARCEALVALVFAQLLVLDNRHPTKIYLPFI